MLDNPHGIHFHYPLKPSRLAKLFQWGCLLIILFITYQVHSINIFLIVAVFSGCYIYYQSRKKVQQLILLTHLDQLDWSIQYEFPSQVKRITIEEILDYQLYFIISIKQRDQKNLIIWYDQLQLSSLKSFKLRAKLK